MTPTEGVLFIFSLIHIAMAASIYQLRKDLTNEQRKRQELFEHVKKLASLTKNLSANQCDIVKALDKSL